MSNPQRLSIVVAVSLLVASCGPGTPPEPTAAPTATPQADVLYLNLVWHQHQPLYYKNDEGLYTRPWVRVHATKDYYDMAALVGEYPGIHVTFNLTPVLMRQLEDFAQNGAQDVYWALAEKPASSLTDEDKRFILERFFDANWTNIVGRYPRYQALLEKRGSADEADIEAARLSFTEQDFRDLQVWFNLAWFDPDFLAQEPLLGLVQKGESFAESDKEIVFQRAREILADILPLHRQLQEAGQIEVITSPYAHPILPLLYNTKLALVGSPGAEMPERFSYPNDAIAQLDLAVEMYTQAFGVPPRGLWPSEGAVAEDIVPLVSGAGFQWMASGEQVLAQSLGISSFSRDAQDTVREADELYRPYVVQGDRGEPMVMVFRDLRLSDLIGFEYSQTEGAAAAQDFLQRLENIRVELKSEGATGPHLVSEILDGENAWENYPNDGKEFLRALYAGLSASETIRTVTPSEYLSMFPEQRALETLFPGAWFSPNYDTWIGESEEATAWDYLLKTRNELAKFDLYHDKTAPSPQALQDALDAMYLAEGSDWFWWYGSDQSSGVDEYFDEGFRALLASVYASLGEEVPSFVRVPIIPSQPVEPARALGGVLTPTMDGRISPADEWDLAASYPAAGGVQARSEDVASGFFVALDKDRLYLRLDLKPGGAFQTGSRVSFYLASPRLETSQPFRRTSPELVGFAATHLLEAGWSGGAVEVVAYHPSPAGWSRDSSQPPLEAASVGDVLEVSLPLESLGELEAGDDLRFLAVVSDGERDLQTLPGGGPARAVFPDLGLTTTILQVEDPSGDDHGPGGYTYPSDSVFQAGVFDLRTFTVGYDDKNMVFTFGFYGSIPNPWGSPNNLAVQTLDVYIDQDPGSGEGARLLLPGRNAALAAGFAWDYAVWAEGWTPQFLTVGDDGTAQPLPSVSFKVLVDPAAQTVSLRVPLAAFGEGDPTRWAYAGVVLSQDGFPSAGVWRVRDVQAETAQWRLGGAPDDKNHTRVIDLAWPAGTDPTQESMLSTYPSSSEPVDALTAEDFAQIPMLYP